jgi:hypothetical protein
MGRRQCRPVEGEFRVTDERSQMLMASNLQKTEAVIRDTLMFLSMEMGNTLSHFPLLTMKIIWFQRPLK